MGKFNQCVQRHITRQNIRNVLGKLQEGTAVTINIEAALRGEKQVANRKIETHLTIARKQNVMAAEKSEINVQAALITAPDALPIDLEVLASTQAFAATNKWDKDAILKHDPAAFKCEKAFALGQKLNKDCKKLRTYASALDFIETTVFLPAVVGHNPYLRTVGELVKAYFLPYMTMKQVAYTTTVGQAIE